MTPRQEKHSARIRQHFAEEQEVKFNIGAKEHPGTELQDMPLLVEIREAKQEFIDGYTYTDDIEEKVQTLRAWLGDLFKILDMSEERLSDDALALEAQVKEMLLLL